MKFCFHIFISLCLVIFQTTVMPYYPFFEKFYDLLSPFIIYLSLFHSVRDSLPVVLFLGFVMDTLSGGPFGLYLSTYVWLFIGVRWIINFLHVGNSFLWPFVIAAGVFMQNCIYIGAIAMLEPGSRFSSATVNLVAVQVFWAIFTGPIFLLSFNYLHGRWDKWLKQVFVKKS